MNYNFVGLVEHSGKLLQLSQFPGLSKAIIKLFIEYPVPIRPNSQHRFFFIADFCFY